MLNYLWAFMILAGIVYGVFTGNMSAITSAAIDSAGEAVSLCITMAGVMAFWMGLMEIGQESGLILRMTKGIEPFLNFLFPRIPKGHPAREYIATNLVANVLGLGWACTPAGLKAMEALAQLERERGNPQYQEQEEETNAPAAQTLEKEQRSEEEQQKMNAYNAYGTTKARRKRWKAAKKGKPAAKPLREASNEMCTFLILNISSLQLIPVNMIAYRSKYGSASPASIIAPALAATLFSSFVAILYCKRKDR